MNRIVLLDNLTEGISVFSKATQIVFFKIEKLQDYVFDFMKDFKEEGLNAECENQKDYRVIRYCLVRYHDVRLKEGTKLKDDGETIEFKERDRAKHIKRLAIVEVKGETAKVITDNILFVSTLVNGMAIAVLAKTKGSDVVLLNSRGEIVAVLGRRSELMKNVDPKTGLTYRELFKEKRKHKNNVHN